MKMNFSIFLFILAMTTTNALAKTKYCYHDDDRLIFNLITSAAVPPLTTTTIIACAIADDAEINKIMIEREATLVVEENKIFVPSFLGSYADKKQMNLYETAEDVLINGVR